MFPLTIKNLTGTTMIKNPQTGLDVEVLIDIPLVKLNETYEGGMWNRTFNMIVLQDKGNNHLFNLTVKGDWKENMKSGLIVSSSKELARAWACRKFANEMIEMNQNELKTKDCRYRFASIANVDSIRGMRLDEVYVVEHAPLNYYIDVLQPKLNPDAKLHLIREDQY